MQGLCHEDAAQIALVGKLAEDGGCRASQGKAEIDGIHQVDGQRHAIDHHKEPAARLLIGTSLLEVQRQKHQHDIRDVGDEDGTGIENQSPLPHLQQMAEGEVRCEVAPVFKQESYAGHKVHHKGQQQITYDGQQRSSQTVSTHIS